MVMIMRTCRPARVCWHNYRPILQIGQGDEAEWFDREGNRIDRDELYCYGQPMFHEGIELGFVPDMDEGLALLQVRYSAAGYDTIYLASNEWGNQVMQRIAEEHFRDNPDCEFVEVYEHAGWHLGFRRDGSIWCTANDAARLERPWPQPTGLDGKHIRREPQ